MTRILFLVMFGAVLSEIDFLPSNTVVMTGEEMTMNCRITNDSLVHKWSFYSPSLSLPAIYLKRSERFQENFRHFGVEENTNGPVRISTNSTRSADAGIYRCHGETDGRDAIYNAHVIVIESVPVCESNLTTNYSNSLNDGDDIWFQCTVNFKGFWAPSMKWSQHGSDLGPERKIVTDGIVKVHQRSQSVTSKLNIAVDSLANGTCFSCEIYFTEYNGNEKTTAENVPSFTYIWNSSVIFLEPHSSTQSNLATTDSVTSFANTSPTTAKTSSVDWYLVSLSAFGVLSLFFIFMVVLAIARCIRFKKKVSDHYAACAKQTIEMPMQESAYDIIPYATSANYETIGDIDTDPSVELSTRPRLGPLPTPGYSGLMPVKPIGPAVYSRMECYETPVDILSDSTLTKIPVSTEVIPEEKSGKIGSPQKDSPTNRRTYLEVRE